MPHLPGAGPTLVALLLSTPVVAQTPAATEAETALATRLVDAACIVLTGLDSTCDRVLLLHSESLDGMVDLLIVSGAETSSIHVARDIARHGGTVEDRARLEAGPDGTLNLHSQQTGFGRYPWFETLTIAPRDGAFFVVGQAYGTYDRPSGGDFSCTIDLQRGQWQATAVRIAPETGDVVREWDVSGRMDPEPVDIVWWSNREAPWHCESIFTQWLDAAP
ncbi:hypothetical protein HKCCE4037_11060 [Rhodobacterales bacterium HKCCE4037]|nr:hypothetical protein [Rhodobacterales bacterium HKCCE4037]